LFKHVATRVLPLVLTLYCGQRHPEAEHAALAAPPPAASSWVVATPSAPDASTLVTNVYAGRTEEEYLAQARDARLPVGTRGNALSMYARAARAAGHGEEAVRNILALKGKIVAPFGDAVFDAIVLADSPSAIPLVLGAGELRRCDATDVPLQRVAPETFRNPDATVVIELSDAFAVLVAVFGLIQSHPDSQEAANAVPDLVAALRCGDERIRQLAGQSIGNVHRLTPADAAALRELLLGYPRAHTRALSATLLGLAPEAATFRALDRGLGDSAELVQLTSAVALKRLKRPERALPVLRRLEKSKDQEIATAAAQVIAEKDR
jgi:hypothetical protein